MFIQRDRERERENTQGRSRETMNRRCSSPVSFRWTRNWVEMKNVISEKMLAFHRPKFRTLCEHVCSVNWRALRIVEQNMQPRVFPCFTLISFILCSDTMLACRTDLDTLALPAGTPFGMEIGNQAEANRSNRLSTPRHTRYGCVSTAASGTRESQSGGAEFSRSRFFDSYEIRLKPLLS